MPGNKVVPRRLQGAGPLGSSGQPHRLDRVDQERLDDCAERLFSHHPCAPALALELPASSQPVVARHNQSTNVAGMPHRTS